MNELQAIALENDEPRARPTGYMFHYIVSPEGQAALTAFRSVKSAPEADPD